MSIVEDYVIETHTTEESILALFTKQNPQWPAFLIAEKAGIPAQTTYGALHRLVRTGQLTVQNGVIRHEGKRRPVKLYSKI